MTCITQKKFNGPSGLRFINLCISLKKQHDSSSSHSFLTNCFRSPLPHQSWVNSSYPKNVWDWPGNLVNSSVQKWSSCKTNKQTNRDSSHNTSLVWGFFDTQHENGGEPPSLDVFIEWLWLHFLSWITFSVRQEYFLVKFPMCLSSPGIVCSYHSFNITSPKLSKSPKNPPNGVKGSRWWWQERLMFNTIQKLAGN